MSKIEKFLDDLHNLITSPQNKSLMQHEVIAALELEKHIIITNALKKIE